MRQGTLAYHSLHVLRRFARISMKLLVLILKSCKDIEREHWNY